jgi:hypothetical protein
MDLDGPLADPQIYRNYLVSLAGGDHLHHLPLSGREAFDALSDRLQFSQHLPVFEIPLDRLLDAVQESLVTERLLDKVDGTGLHGVNRHFYVSMACDKNNGEHGLQGRQPCLQLNPAHVGHANIKNQATCSVGIICLEKFACGTVGFRRISNRFHEHAKAVSHRFVIIHDEYRWRGYSHSISPALTGIDK